MTRLYIPHAQYFEQNETNEENITSYWNAERLIFTSKEVVMSAKSTFLVAILFAFCAIWAQGGLVINEIMYNSLGIDQEWIEFFNIVDSDVALDSSWILTDGEGWFNFPEIVVHPGEYMTVIVDTALEGDSIMIHFEPDVDATGHNIKLANTGDDVILLQVIDGDTFVVDSVTYSPDWVPESDGDGPSMERIDPYGEPNDPANWAASVFDWGTPGAANPVREKFTKPATININTRPNPFNESCEIKIVSQKPGCVKIIDIAGKEIAVWQLVPGVNSLVWTPTDNPSGLYIIAVNNGTENISSSIIFLQ